MKRNKSIFLLLFSLQNIALMAQPTISSDIGAQQLVCPSAQVPYKINYPYGYSECQVTWSIVSGSGSVSSYTTNPTTVTWDVGKPNKVTIQAVVKYYESGGSCTSPESITLNFTHILRSVFGETPVAGTLPVVSYCNTSPINILVDHMYIQNTGNSGQPSTAEVENYRWRLPSGWQQVNGSGGQDFFTELNAISIEPTNPGGNCSTGGNITVTGIAGATSCAGLLVRESLRTQ